MSRPQHAGQGNYISTTGGRWELIFLLAQVDLNKGSHGKSKNNL